MNDDKTSKVLIKSKKHFILYRGILGWGLITCILWSVIMAIISFSPFKIRPFEFKVFLLCLSTFPLWMFGGFLWGLWMWKLTKKKHPDKSIT